MLVGFDKLGMLANWHAFLRSSQRFRYEAALDPIVWIFVKFARVVESMYRSLFCYHASPLMLTV